MIPEHLQDQAASYALDLLSASEARDFEAQLRNNPELQALVRQLGDTTGELARLAPPVAPPPALRDRVLREVAVESQSRTPAQQESPRLGWIPWAIAAALAISSVWLAMDRARLHRELRVAEARDPLSVTRVYVLAPAAPTAPDKAKATVTWASDAQTGVIKISNLPNPGPTKDYQLWAVDEKHTDPVSAGIVKVDANGAGEIRFKPADRVVGVKAFAISLEREGGVPKAEGPILLAGTGS